MTRPGSIEYSHLGAVLVAVSVVTSLIGIVVGLQAKAWIVLWIGLVLMLVGMGVSFFEERQRDMIERRALRGSPLEAGRDVSWRRIVGRVFRVLDFEPTDRAATEARLTLRGMTLEDSRLEAFMELRERRFREAGSIVDPILVGPPPYGYLTVESPLYRSRIRLPVHHEDDFRLLGDLFGDKRSALDVTSPDRELLVTYVPPHDVQANSHDLHFVITLRDTLERYHAHDGGRYAKRPAPEKIFPEFIFTGSSQVMVNMEPQL